eukprot:gene9997-18624_t
MKGILHNPRCHYHYKEQLDPLLHLLTVKCYYCQGDHYSYECGNVTSVKDRKSILMKARRCFNCLNLGHLQKDCRSQRGCLKCKGRHHQSLCQSHNERAENKPPKNAKIQDSFITATATQQGCVLLQTATTYAYGKNRDKKIEVQVLFDNGSQRSYIREELKEKLLLDTVNKENLKLNTFAQNEETNENPAKTEELKEALATFWKHEAGGLSQNVGESENSSKKVLDIEFTGERYSVSLPWKENYDSPLPSDYKMCLGRLESVYTRLKGKPELLKEYDSIIKEQLTNDIIEIVPNDQLRHENSHFISHHCVLRDDKVTTKVRVVFDGSACSNENSLSLNDRLEVGENFIPPLFETLIRFRVHAVALTADIEKAFLQIEVKDSDRDALRFLWYDDVNSASPNVVQFRIKRLSFGLTCSPGILGATIRYHVNLFADQHPKSTKVLNRLYCDDLSCGAASIDEAFEIYQNCQAIMEKGGFNLRKWNSNKAALLDKINPADKSLCDSTPSNISPQVQEDDQSYSKYKVEGNTVEKMEIHAFSDASEKAYACVVYLRIMYTSGEVDVKFIASKAKEWPAQAFTESSSSAAAEERGSKQSEVTHVNLSTEGQQTSSVLNIIDINRFSSKGRLLRSLAWVHRFLNNLRSSVRKENLVLDQWVTADEISQAETVLIKGIQQQSFNSEIEFVIGKSKSKQVPPLVNQFNLFTDEQGLLRCKSRLLHASVVNESKTPILLPSKSYYSELVIAEAHSKVFHDGISETLNCARQKYWILRGREMAKKHIRRCGKCKWFEGSTFKFNVTPDLPKIRVDDSPPFSNVGVDFAGPLMNKGIYTKGKTDNKSYVCLFTCAATRAVHLELVEALDVDSFIRSFRRFTARRGLPIRIIFDNAKTFKTMSKEVKQLIRSPKLSSYLETRGVTWDFILDRSPWQGGMWERLERVEQLPPGEKSCPLIMDEVSLKSQFL